MRLTARTISDLTTPPGRAEAFFWDDDLPGFGLRAHAGGKRSWICQYRIGKRQRRVTIGDARVLSPPEARERAGEVLAKARLGQDFQAEAREGDQQSIVTFGSVTQIYIARNVEGRQRSARDTIRYLRRYFAPLHTLPIHQLTRRHIALRLSEIADDHGLVTSNRSRAAVHALLTWAVRQGVVDANVAAGTAKATPENSRQRLLSARELRAIWHALGDGDFGSIVRLLLLTGQRREEVASMRWSELDLDRASWSLPGARTKNRLGHYVPLARQALAIVATLPRRDGRDLVFGSGRGGFSGFSAAKQRLDERSGTSGWRLHDLRRVAVTGMAEIGVEPHVIEAVVNHQSGHKGGVAGVYNRATYAMEKRAALQLWADHLDGVVGVATAKAVFHAFNTGLRSGKERS